MCQKQFVKFYAGDFLLNDTLFLYSFMKYKSQYSVKKKINQELKIFCANLLMSIALMCGFYINKTY